MLSRAERKMPLWVGIRLHFGTEFTASVCTNSTMEWGGDRFSLPLDYLLAREWAVGLGNGSINSVSGRCFD